MAVKRRPKKGLATTILCVLANEGRAPSRYLARRFGYSERSVDRVLESLEERGVASMATGGDYYITQKGSSMMYGRCSTSMKPHETYSSVPRRRF